ncbi:MAG: TIM barrel protein, partial [Planctomycetota bacterium]
MPSLTDTQAQAALDALDHFNIELPSWGFADTGTRFGKFRQDAAASTTEEKFHDAGLVHKLVGCCPTVAVHVLWDFDVSQPAEQAAKDTVAIAEKNHVKVGSINPNVFQSQAYKLGSFCSPDAAARHEAMEHSLYCVDILKHTDSKVLSMWLADGTNYPGQDNLRVRKKRLEGALKEIHDAMPDESTMLVEYKPFEPAFYHTDIADWGMAATFAFAAGPKARVLVDTGHHLPGQNIEHIVAFLLDEVISGRPMLGGFHFNDRKYADDDLTMGSIDPYAVFRIFNEIAQHTHDTGSRTPIEYMVDQSHNLKPKLEAMVQTAVEAQKQYARAHAVDRKELAEAQNSGDIVEAELCLKNAFEADVTPVLEQWRSSRNLPADPLEELRSSGIIDKLGKERAAN